MTTVSTKVYARSHSEIFLSERMRNLLKDLVVANGLDPAKLIDEWKEWVDRGVRAWLATGDLQGVVIEFYKLGSETVAARWDFPIRYDGAGSGEMWVDQSFFEESFAKAARPPAGCTYRVLLQTRSGRPDVAGIVPAAFKSLGNLMGRDAGTVIATPHLAAGVRYYK